MSTSFFDFASRGDTASELARFVGETEYGTDRNEAYVHFMNGCRQAIEGGDYYGFIRRILDRTSSVMSKRSEKDIESSFFLTFSFLRSLSSKDKTATVDRICSLLTESTDQKPVLRLQILTNLFNMLDDTEEKKYTTFCRLVDFSTAIGELRLLKRYFQDASLWPEKWPVGIDRIRHVYLIVSEQLQSAGNGEEAQTFRIHYLRTFENAHREELPQARKTAAEAARSYMRAPVVSQKMNLMHMTAVKQLQGDAEYGKLYQLLVIFSQEGLKDYLQFYSENKQYMSTIGLDHEKSLETMRLLTISTLAAKKKTIPYGEIASAIQCDEGEVETWLVHAITAGLVEGRMDQLSKTFEVSRTIHRRFDRGDWLEIQQKLHSWRDSLPSILSLINSRQGGSTVGSDSAASTKQ